MYLSMNSETLTSEALRHDLGSLTFELASSLNDDLSELATENEKLETEASEASNQKIDCCSEAVYRLEQIEDYLQAARNNPAFEAEHLDSAQKLLKEAVVYFNNMQDC